MTDPNSNKFDPTLLLKQLTGDASLKRSQAFRDLLLNDQFYPMHEPTEDELRLGAIEKILVEGSMNMSPRMVAETVLKISRQRMDYRGHVELKYLVQRHLDSDVFTPAREARDEEEHRAECCVHTCKFGEFECPVTNGAATADMPCEGDHE